jgi:DNA modification methylase
MSINKLILGDNLEILKGIESETIDLIYLDPPFFSNRNYEVIWGDEGEVRSFEDRWAGGIEHYIAWLKERVIEMHRILKPAGSIFLHCDWHADAYIRVEILDNVFGMSNFRNHILWKRNFTKKGSQFKMTRYAQNTDSIFFYSKSDNYFFETPRIKNINDDALLKIYNNIDEEGRRYKSEPIELPRMMARKNLVFEYKGYTPKFGWMMSKEKLDELDNQNKIFFTKNGKPRRKNFLDDYSGSEIDNQWLDILPVGQSQSEIIGYPTQKPEALLQRIIECASNEGDIVLDPFVGGGTTIAVADKLNRSWIGIDQSVAAIRVSDLRLKNQQNLYSKPYELLLRTHNYDLLRNQNAFEFETWIIEQFGGIPNPKQRSDFGLDGRMADNTPIQVKRSDNVGRNVIDNFFAAIQRSDKQLFEKNKTEGKTAGYIIAFSFGRSAIEEVARLKNKEHIVIELKKVSEIVSYEKPPKVSLVANEIELSKYIFEATAESETGIEFFSWDFNHKPEDGFKADIYLDKAGKQVRKFQPGEHHIAVEAVDKSGLDGMDKIKLKVNEPV